jgi:hypothetical protein
MWSTYRNKYYDHMYQLSWVLGFISGLELADASEVGTKFKRTDDSGMEKFIDGYCAQHPLDTLETASEALFFELVKGGKP